MRSASRDSDSRPVKLRSAIVCTSSTSWIVDARRPRAQPGSMSRGTARSISSSGLPSRAAIISSSSSRSTMWCGELVEETTMSALSSWVGKLVEADRLAAEAAGEPDRAVVAAVGDEDGLDAAGGERPRGQLGGLAGADQQHAAAKRGRPERAPGELDGGGGNGDAALADPRLGAHALAGRERAAEEAVEDRAGRALDQRQLVGALDLALDLGLAEDHRVEAGGDVEEVAGGLDAAVGVEALDELGRADPGLAGEGRRGRRSRRRPGRRRAGRARCGCRSRPRRPRRSARSP